MLSWIAERASEDAAALVRPGGEVMTYGSLAMASAAVQQALTAAAGEVAARAVGVAVGDPAGFLACALAVLEAGGVVVPLETRGGDELTAAQAARAQVAAVLVGSPEDDRIDVALGRGARPLPAEAAVVVFTSAASPGARAVVLGRAGLAAAVDAAAGAWPLDGSTRLGLTAPLLHVTPLVTALATLRAGGALLDLGGGDGDRDPEAARRLGRLVALDANAIAAAPAELEALAQAALADEAAARPALSWIAGDAPLGVRAASTLLRAFPRARLCLRWDLPEAPALAALDGDAAGIVATRHGRLLAGVEARGGEGGLELRGPSLMLGYFDDEPATRAALADGWLRTGLGARDDEDGYLTVTPPPGRVVVRGEPVELADVEQQLQAAAGAGELALVAVPDEAWGTRLYVFVSGAGSAARVAARARALGPAARPFKIAELESLPHTAAGDVDREALRRMASPT